MPNPETIEKGFISANQVRKYERLNLTESLLKEANTNCNEVQATISDKVRELERAKDLLDYICTTFSLQQNQKEIKERFPELWNIIEQVWLPKYKTIKV